MTERLTTRLAIAAAAAILAGCTPQSNTPSNPEPGSAQPPTASTPADATSSPKPAGTGTSGATPDAAATIESALTPAETSPPAATIADATALAAAKKTVDEFIAAMKKGDSDAAKKLLVDEELSRRILNPSHLQIMGTAIVSANREIVDQLIGAVKDGAATEWQWRPGDLVTAPGAQGAFRDAYPLLTKSSLAVEIDGAYVEIGVDQLIFVENRWRIFSLSAP